MAYFNDTHYETRALAVEAIDAIRGAKYGVTHFAGEHINLTTRVPYWRIQTLTEPLSVEQQVRSERHVYTPSGKKRTNKQVCLGLYRAIKARDAFIRAAMETGVKAITARTLFNDIAAGRIA